MRHHFEPKAVTHLLTFLKAARRRNNRNIKSNCIPSTLEKLIHQSTAACHQVASLHPVLPSIWLLWERKFIFFSSCLSSFISLVSENVPQHALVQNGLCCVHAVLSCQRGGRDCWYGQILAEKHWLAAGYFYSLLITKGLLCISAVSQIADCK